MPPRSRMAVDETPEPAVEQPAPETTVDETPEPAVEQPAPETTVDETPEPAVDETPDEVAAPVVTCVRVTEAFTASYGCQLLPLAAGEIVRGAVAVFLSTAGVPVEPVDED